MLHAHLRKAVIKPPLAYILSSLLLNGSSQLNHSWSVRTAAALLAATLHVTCAHSSNHSKWAISLRVHICKARLKHAHVFAVETINKQTNRRSDKQARKTSSAHTHMHERAGLLVGALLCGWRRQDGRLHSCGGVCAAGAGAAMTHEPLMYSYDGRVPVPWIGPPRPELDSCPC